MAPLADDELARARALGARRARRRRRAGAAAGARAAQVATLGDVPERRLAEAARRRALPLRALVRRAPLLRRPARRARSSASCARARRRASRSTRSRRVRPYDDPGAPFWYRLQPIEDDDRPQDAHRLPARRPRGMRAPARSSSSAATGSRRACRATRPTEASNPFVAFAEIPARSRYQYLLDDAQYFVDDLHPRPGLPRPGGRRRDRGPLLRRLPRSRPRPLGDRPDLPAENAKLLDLPAEHAERVRARPALARVQREAAQVPGRARAASTTRSTRSASARRSTGSGTATARTATRCSPCSATSTTPRSCTASSATIPKTAWVMDYPIFERIYYDLVAGYDVFGNVGAPGRDAPLHGPPAHAVARTCS